MKTGRRVARFNAVGLAGIGVQLGVLAALTSGLGLHYLPATGLAVTAAVLHNFLWHRHWTWADRRAPRRSGAGSGWAELMRFAGANGLVSLAGNVALMPLFVNAAGLSPVSANLAAIAACGLVNYFLADRVVFAASAPNPIAPCKP